MHYFGDKLVVVSTLSGIPLIFDIVPAHTDEREAAAGVLGHLHNCHIIADKGFIGEDWQAEVARTTGNRVWTSRRNNQHQQNPSAFDRLLSQVRERIEGVFHEVQNTGRHLERLLRKSWSGLLTHVAAKMTSHTLRRLLRHQFGIDVLSFDVAPSPLT